MGEALRESSRYRLLFVPLTNGDYGVTVIVGGPMRKTLLGALVVIGSILGLYEAYKFCVKAGKAEALECLLHNKSRYFTALDPCLWDEEEGK